MSGIIQFDREIDYSPGSIVSKIILDNKEGNITLFAFDAGQKLSEHTAPFDAFLQIVEGEAIVSLDGKDNQLSAGMGIVMPADIPHAFYAAMPVKMLLCMFKNKEK